MTRRTLLQLLAASSAAGAIAGQVTPELFLPDSVLKSFEPPIPVHQIEFLAVIRSRAHCALWTPSWHTKPLDLIDVLIIEPDGSREHFSAYEVTPVHHEDRNWRFLETVQRPTLEAPVARYEITQRGCRTNDSIL